MILNVIALRQRRHQLAGDAGDFLRTRHIRQQHRELVAAKPRDHVGRTQALAQTASNRLEQLVADRVAKTVIDELETVEVEIEHGCLLVRAIEARENLVEPLLKPRAVRQAGQCIMMRHMRDPSFRLPALGDIHTRHQHRGLVAIGQPARIHQHFDFRTVVLDVAGTSPPLHTS